MVSDEAVPALLDEKLQNGDVIIRDAHAPSKVTPSMVLRTVAVVLVYMVMGMYLEIVGPTLPDLMQRVNCNFEEISRALVIHSAGYFLSCVTGGVLTDRFSEHVQLFITTALLLAAVGTGLAPWVSSLEVLCLLVLCRGLSQGSIDTYCNFLCIKIWQSRAAVPIHLLHFCFGVGAFLIPQIARPFLGQIQTRYNESAHSFVDTNLANVKDVHGLNQTMHSPLIHDYVADVPTNGSSAWISRIEIPYTICACLAGTLSIAFLAMYLCDKEVPEEKTHIAGTGSKLELKTSVEPTPRKSGLRGILSPGSCTDGHPRFGIQFFVLMFLFSFNTVGCDNAIGRFLYSFATESDLGFGVDQAATLNSVYWVCFTCGRGLTIFVARWLHPRTMLIVQTCLNVSCATVLTIWGATNPVVLWVFMGLLGISLSPVIPTGLAWANRYVVMKGVSLSVVFMGGAAGSMFYQWITGYLFQIYGPRMLLYIVMVYSLVLAVVVTLMLTLVCRRPERFSDLDQVSVSDPELVDIKSSASEKVNL